MAPVKRSSRGFTLIELLAVVGIIAVLLAILLPSVGRVKEMSRTTACQANIRAISMSLLTFTTQHKQQMPMDKADGSNPGWYADLWKRFGVNEEAFVCPSVDDHSPAVQTWKDSAGNNVELAVEFGINSHYATQPPGATVASLARLTDVSKVIAFAEVPAPRTYFEGSKDRALSFRHKSGEAINVAMFDGHAETWSMAEASKGDCDVVNDRSADIANASLDVLPWRQKRAPNCSF